MKMKELHTFGVYKGEGKHQEEALYSMALLYNIISTDISHYLKKYNLTIGKLNVLITIKHHGGDKGIRQVEVSKHLIVTPSNMTNMIDKLEKESLVKRCPLAGDRRVNITKITRKGSDLLDKLWPGYNEVLKNQMKDLSKDKQKAIAALLVEWFEKRV
jgi:MarR family 2-MHQ and catechol resistance regulon transcriptional repressor